MLHIRTLDVAEQVQISHLASSEKCAYTISLDSRFFHSIDEFEQMKFDFALKAQATKPKTS